MREKKQVVVAPDEAGAKESIKDFCSISSKLKAIEAKQEQEILKIRDKFKSQVADLQEKKAKAFELVQAYAEENKEDLFSKKKSLDWSFALFGFRTGTPKVEKKRGITWDAALALIKNLELPFIRTKEEVDREKIIMSREDPEVTGSLAKIGINVVQTETFFIEPKEEELVNA